MQSITWHDFYFYLLFFLLSNWHSAILELLYQKKCQCKIVLLLSVCRDVMSRVIKLGHEGDRLEKRRKRFVNTSSILKIIKKRINRNPRVSMKRITLETGINRKAANRKAKNESVQAKKCSCSYENNHVRGQNNRCGQASDTTTVKHRQNLQFVMVWGGI